VCENEKDDSDMWWKEFDDTLSSFDMVRIAQV